MSPLVPGLYRHFKGQYYEVLHVARHSETEEEFVVYRPCYGERGIWIRPRTMFEAMVDAPSGLTARFTRVMPPTHFEPPNDALSGAPNDVHRDANTNPNRDAKADGPGAQGETCEVLLESQGLRVERITSHGDASPPGFWYDQDDHEWVLLLAGEALLRFAEEPTARHLSAWSHLLIPAHAKHRVDWTTPDGPTVWLAIFFSPLSQR